MNRVSSTALLAAGSVGGPMAGSVAGSIALAGCGFRPKGSTDLQFDSLYTNFPPGSPIGIELERELARSTTTRLVKHPNDAAVRLIVLYEGRERDILAYSSVGVVTLFELRVRLRFRAVDSRERELLPGSEIILRREISATTSQLISRVDEEAMLYRDMERDAVRQLMRRLATLRPGE